MRTKVVRAFFAGAILALVTDYDGTMAADGHVPAETVAAMGRLRQSRRRAILVTGRRLDELLPACPQIDMFDYVVAENGGLVYAPRTRTETPLGKPPPAEFVERLRHLGVNEMEEGRVIVSTWLPITLLCSARFRNSGWNCK